MPRRGAGMVAVAVALVLTAACGLPGRGRPQTATPEASASAAALPDDPCGLMPAALRDQLVPLAAVKESETEQADILPGRASCELATDTDRTTSTAQASLEWTVDRQAGTRGADGARDSARSSYDVNKRSVDDLYDGEHDVDGLGDAAYTGAKAESGEGRLVRTRLLILAGTDLVTITYEPQPSTTDAAAAAVLELARFLLPLLGGARSGGSGAGRGSAAPSTGPTVAASPFVGTSPKVPKAVLRSLPTVTVVGATWKAGEEAYTMDLHEYPFAFRSPMSWNCFRDSKDTSGNVWTCGAPNKEAAKPARMRLILRPCPAPCSATTRATMDRDWLGTGAPTLQTFDATTTWTQSTSGGTYTLVMSHFFGASAGGPPVWHVGVRGQAGPGDQTVALQKVLNDIRSQTP